MECVVIVISTFPALSANFSTSMFSYHLWPETGEVRSFEASTHFYNLSVGFRICSRSPCSKLCQWLFHQVLITLNAWQHFHYQDIVKCLVVEIFKLSFLVLPAKSVEVEYQLVYYTVSDTERCFAEDSFKAVGRYCAVGVGLSDGSLNLRCKQFTLVVHLL